MTDAPLPDPLTPADCDLRKFRYLPLDVVRLRDSDFSANASDAAFRAGVLLWAAAWHQVPAASLPNNPRTLAQLAGYGRAVEAFEAIRAEAMAGFVLCSDGRLYHPVVAEKAREAWGSATSQRKRTEAARIAAERKRAETTGNKSQGDGENGNAAQLQNADEVSNRGAKNSVTASKRDRDGDRDREGTPPNPPDGGDDGPGAKVSGSVWMERIDELHRLCGSTLSGSSIGARNPAPLRALIEVEGLAWPDVREAVVAVASTVATKSRPLHSFKHPMIASTAHGNAEIRKGAHNGRGIDRSPRDGQGARGLAGAAERMRIRAGDDANGDDGRTGPRTAAEFVDSLLSDDGDGENPQALGAG